jgi:predicted DCC family thiol-disulfide oxidoreductase YuxK
VVWDKLSNLFFPNNKLVIYYDEECGFCYRSVVLIKNFLLHNKTKILPAQSDPLIYSEMQAHNSWVVTNAKRQHFYKFDAGVEIARNSPLRWVAVPITKIPGVNTLGKRAYRVIANRRTNIPLPQNYQLGWFKDFSDREKNVLFTTVVSCVFLLITIGNIYSLTPQQESSNFARILANFRFNQNWGVFTPIPNQYDGWYILRATTTDNNVVDLLRDQALVNYDKPADVSNMFANQRWRRMHFYMSFDQNEFLRQPYLEWLCREYNQTEQRVEAIDLIYALEFTTPTSTQPVRYLNLDSIACTSL